MIKCYFLALVLIVGFNLSAQQFYEWSAGGESTALTFQYMVADESGVIAVAETNSLNMVRKTPRFLQSEGEESMLSGYSLNQPGQLLLFFDKAGKISRKIEFRPQYESIHGIVINDHHDILLLVYVEATETGENEWPMGYLPAFSGRNLHPAGFNLVFLTREGKFRKSIAARDINPSSLDIFNFEWHPNGSLVLAGGADPGKPALNKEAEILGGGGDFVIMLDTNGSVQWADAISYRESTCCTRLSQNTSLSIAPDGTTYFGGAYRNGGIFSNDLTTLVPKKYKKNNDGFEAYIISYSEKGKINWVKVYEEQSVLYALQGTKLGVYASHKTQGELAFGTKVDTSRAKSTGLTFLDKKGKVKWTKMFRSYKVHDITLSGDALIFLYTALNLNINQEFKIGETQLPERTQILLTSLDQNQDLKVLKTGTFRLESRNEPILFAGDNMGNFYLGGNIFCTLPIDLERFDPSLPPVECYGSAPVIGKVLAK